MRLAAFIQFKPMLAQSAPLRFIHRLLEPRTDSPRDAFRERTLRLIVLIVVVIFSVVGLLDPQDYLHKQGLLWYGVIYGVAITVFAALHYDNVRLASIAMIPALLMIVLDVTVAYWSPGTIVLGLMFTFIFQIIMVNRIDMVLAVLLNLVVYTLLVVFPTGQNPLDPRDYFASPLAALLTTYSAHFIIIGVTGFIRRELGMLGQMEQQALRCEQERLEFALKKEQELSDLKSQMMNRIGHEFRTPLAIIQTSSALLEHYTERLSPERRQGKFAAINGQIRNISEMLDSMSEVVNNHLSSHVFDPHAIALADLVENLVEQFAVYYDHHHIFSVELAASPIIQADGKLLEMALSDVLSNAIHYSPPHTEIRVVVSSQDNRACIQVSDTGIGIPPDEQALIFNPFFRGTNIGGVSGLGLGLTIVQRAISAHQGQISVNSRLYEGTTITLQVPIVQDFQTASV